MEGGEDPKHLREVQYKDSSNLGARARLHERYGTATIGWFDFVASLVDWDRCQAALDAGCGNGLVWPTIDARLQHPIEVTLADLSAGMIEEARARTNPLAHIRVVRAEVADVQELPFADDSFDVVLANHMLYHVPDHARAVRELARVLRGDGVLIAATNGSNSMPELTALRETTPGFAQRFSRENGAAILGDAFADVTWHSYQDELHCTDADDVVAYIESMSPGALTPADVDRLRATITERMVDGVFRVTKDTGAFVARNNAQP